MKKVDFLFIYEVRNRELENIILLAAELEKRGYTTAFLNSWWCLEHDYEDYDAEVVIVSACYNSGTYGFFTSHAAKFKKVLNLQWEQVLRNGYAETDEVTSWDFEGEALRTMHACWGENTKRRLMKKYNVPEEFLKVCGYISLDFYRPEFKPFIKDKKELYDEFGLDINKPCSLFVSSFSIITMPKENQGIAPGNFNEVFIEQTAQTQKQVLDWFERACEKYPDMQFIYRAHPSESDNVKLAQMAENIPNFYYISKYPVKHWIMNVDKIYNWTSTTAAEVYASGKQSFILEPVPVEHIISYPFFEGGESVKTFEEFCQSIEMDVNRQNQPLDISQFDDCYLQTQTPVYVNLCNELENILKDNNYQSYYNPDNVKKKKEKKARLYKIFWESPLNLLLYTIAENTKWNVHALNVRRTVPKPTKAYLRQQKEYNEGRVRANYTTEEEIRNLISQVRKIIG